MYSSYLTINFSSFKQLFKVTGPLFICIVPWILVLLGHTFPLCGIIVERYTWFHLIVIGNMFTALAFAFYFEILYPKKSVINSKENIGITSRFKRIVFISIFIYFLVEFFQVIYFQGFPLLWLILGIPKTYFDYGIPSLNGFIKAIYLFATTGFCIIYLEEKKRWQFLVLIFLLSIPVALVTRQVLMSVFLQCACCCLIYRPHLVKRFLIFGIILLAVFIYVGNIRSGLMHLVEILRPYDYYPQFLYPLLWIYAYVVTPFNNINAAFDSITPFGYPYREISSLIPTALRGDSATESVIDLVHKNMTVSTFYVEPLVDFGPFYAFMFMAVFQYFLFTSFKRVQNKGSLINILEYSILYMIMILSIFSNLLLALPVAAQLILANVVKLRLVTKNSIRAIAWTARA